MSEKDSDKVDEKYSYDLVSHSIVRHCLGLIASQQRKITNKIPFSEVCKVVEHGRGSKVSSSLRVLGNKYLTQDEQYEYTLWVLMAHVIRVFWRNLLSDDEKKLLDEVSDMAEAVIRDAALREAKPPTDEEKEEVK